MKKALAIALVAVSMVSAAPVQAGLLSDLVAAVMKVLPGCQHKE